MEKPKVIWKFVKKAGMFCVTYWSEKGEQKQEWISDEEKARQRYSELLEEHQKVGKSS